MGNEEHKQSQKDTAGADSPASIGYVSLLPCPFCGCPHINMEHDVKCFIGQKYPGDKNMNSNPDGYRRRCEDCGASTTWWHTERQADTAWNQRAT